MKTTPALPAMLAVLCLASVAPAQPEPEKNTAREIRLEASTIDTLLNTLTENGTLKIENRSRRPLGPLTFTSPKAMPGERIAAGITELLGLRGIAVSRKDTTLLIEDTPDPSEALVLQVRDKSLQERLPVLTRELAAQTTEPAKITAMDLPLDGIATFLELATGRTLLLDSPMPRLRFSCGEASMSRLEILTAIDAYLVKNHVYLVEHDTSFVKVVHAPALMSGAFDTSPLTDSSVQDRMERVAEEIRKRREARQETMDAQTRKPKPEAAPGGK